MIPAAVRIFVCTEFIDMRQGFDRLAQVVKAKLGEDPQAGSIFVFANRNADSAEGVVVRRQRILPTLQAASPCRVRIASFRRWHVRTARRAAVGRPATRQRARLTSEKCSRRTRRSLTADLRFGIRCA